MSGSSESTATRAQRDLARGMPWKARQRLESRLAKPPFDAECARLLGRLELGYGEHLAAGRCFWMLDDRGPEHTRSIEVFLDQVKRGALRKTATLFVDAEAGTHALTVHQIADLEAKGLTPEKLIARRVERLAGRKSASKSMLVWAALVVVVGFAATAWTAYGLALLVGVVVRLLRSL